jgi:hypothetical protein
MAGTDSTVGSSLAWPRIGSQQHTAIRAFQLPSVNGLETAATTHEAAVG